jgi:hypothetical protein
MSGRPRIVTFFVIQVPPGFKPRAWGKRYRNTYGFDYDHSPPGPTELLVWPSEIPAAVLRRNLQAGGVCFRTFRGNPERMFNVQG